MNGIDDENQKIIEIKEVLSELPTEHSQNIAALFKILCKVEALSEHNKMTIDNLIVVVGPNLLWDDSKVQTCKRCLTMFEKKVTISEMAPHKQAYKKVVLA